MADIPAKGEIDVFVLWPKARFAQDRIMEDLRGHAEVLAAFEANWPDGLSAEEGYSRFYGPLLPDAKGKVKRAGSGAFFVIIARVSASRYGWRMTQRGLENVNLDVFEMKWHYREWTGGLHTLHGTITREEARRDIMLLTAHTLEEWDSGAVSAKDVTVLPGQRGWRDMAELLRFMNEVHPYAVMRNADELPDRLDPVHGDVDILAANAAWCAVLMNAKKTEGGCMAAYTVDVAGAQVRFDIRETGDGYYDEPWERALLAGRVKNGRGFYEFAPRDGFFALVYHILYTKLRIATDYHAKVLAQAKAAGVGGTSFDEWWRALDGYMTEKHYRAVAPRDRSVRLIPMRIGWRLMAAEASDLFGISGAVPLAESATELVMDAEMEGSPVRVTCLQGDWARVRTAYDMQLAFHEAAPEFATEPLRCHVGRDCSYLVVARPAGVPLGRLLCEGWKPSGAVLERMGAEAARLAAALDSSGVVHRNINAWNLMVSPDGGLGLTWFDSAVDRRKGKVELPYFRRDIAGRLVPLGGEGVFPPAPSRREGWWNDRRAIARTLAPLASGSKVLKAALDALEAEAAAGKGALRIKRRKMTFRLLSMWFEYSLRGLASPRRRRSLQFMRVRAFVRAAFLG